MDEVEAGQTGATPPRGAGETLRAAREAQGLTLAEVGARTRVPLRHLEAIETGDYQSLPSPTYAVGFARAYARAVGANDVAIAHDVSAEVDRIGRRQPEYAPYEVADPSRVPSRGVAIVAAGLALGLLVLAALWFGGTWLRTPAAPEETAPVVAAVPAPTASPAAVTPASSGGEVVLTAQDEVWLRVYDAADKSLYLGTMRPGERFVVPADAADPRINVGRPDQLAITLNGAAVPPLGTGARPVSGVRIGGEAIAARIAGAPAPTPSPAATSAPVAAVPPAFAPAPAERPRPAAERPTARVERRTTDRPPPRRPRPSPTVDAPENLLPSGFSKGT